MQPKVQVDMIPRNNKLNNAFKEQHLDKLKFDVVIHIQNTFYSLFHLPHEFTNYACISILEWT
jgi:hypothetical protein